MKTRKKIYNNKTNKNLDTYSNNLHKFSLKKKHKNRNININSNIKNRSDFYPIQNCITHLRNEYENRLIELQIKQVKFKASLRECLKWKTNLNKEFLALKKFNIPNNKCSYDVLKLKVKYIENIITKINVEHSYIIALSEVCYRSKYGLLHTLPKKKLKIIENIFPNIQKLMLKSKINYKPQKNISFPKKQSIRFGKVYIKKF